MASAHPRCPDCGAELSVSGPDAGLCSLCLVRIALGDQAEAANEDPSDPRQDTPIVPYRLIEKVGEGGMGEVYRAEQIKPVRRIVALKVIRRGLDSKEVITRLESERQALALMDHASIAKVFDAGETGDGRPYFVMEYVDGVPITNYCDRNRLGVAERLGLFARVCEGVQHAHQKTVIHRDLKPSNVLVTDRDGEAIPKIIDFGTAKATAQKLTEKTLFTELGVLIGTPEYMSPEQAGGNSENVDTRSDVYSLGVLLYELLTGALPFDPVELRRAGFEAICRTIRERDPPRPSTRLTTLGEEAARAARDRRTDPRHLAGALRGDLDWIVMKALEKDRDRRYGSPSDLAADLRRHLAHEPVTAGPPSIAYRVRKFVRRQRLAVAMAVLVVAALLAGAGVATWGLVRARRSEESALAEAETARQSLAFMTRVFGATDPWNEQGRPLSARDLLDAGEKRIREELASQPLVQATLMEVMGEALQHQWANDRAEALFREALAIREEEEGPGHPATIRVMILVSNVLARMGRVQESIPIAREALERAQRSLGDEHLLTLNAKQLVATRLGSQGRFEESLRLLQECLDVAKRSLGERHPRTMAIQINLGNMYESLGQYEQAESLTREALEYRQRELGPDHPLTVTAAMYLGETFLEARRLEEAREILAPAVEARLRLQGEDHPMTLMTRFLLGRTYREMGRLDDAERTLTDVLRRRLAVLGPTHPDTPPTYRALGLVYLRQGRRERIERLYEEALQALPPGSKQLRDRLTQEIEQFRAMPAEEDETLRNLPFLPYEQRAKGEKRGSIPGRSGRRRP